MKYSLILTLLSTILLVQCSRKTTPPPVTMVPADASWRANAPVPAAAREIELGEYQHFTMENGLTVIVVENSKLPRVAYQITLKNDPILEGGKAGYTTFAGTLLGSGTTKRSKSELDEAIDFIGASITPSSQGIFASSLTKHQDELLNIMTEMLYHPSFPAEEFEKIKKQTLSALAAVPTNPEAIASNVTRALNYGKNHPYGEFETPKTINNIELEDCKQYYETYFKPNNAYLIIVGDISLPEAKQKAETYFSSWEKKEIPPIQYSTPSPLQDRRVSFAHRDGAVQSVIRITYPIELEPGSEDVIKASITNAILGGGVFLGRLMQNLREDKGYTYGARSSLSSDPLVGNFSATASVRNEVTDSAIVEFIHEMDRMINEPVSSDDLQLAKNSLAGSFARSLESPQTLANFALNTLKYNLPDDYYSTYLQRLEKISVTDVQNAAKKYIRPDRAHIVVVGNKDETADKLISFDDRGVIDFYDAFANPIVYEEYEVQGDIQPIDIISNYLDKIGGKEFLMNVKTMKRTSTLAFMGQNATMTTRQKSPGMYAMSLEMQGMTIQNERFNKDVGSSSMMGSAQKFTEGDQFEALKRASLIIPQLYYQPESLALKGIEKIGNEKMYRIAITLENGKVAEEFYSMESGLLMRTIETQDGMDGNSITLISDMEDYREAGGILIPFKMVLSGASPQPISLTTTDVEVNHEIPDNVFLIE